MMPLTMTGCGEVSTIRKVGGNEETRRFLENLGFVSGTKITVLSEIGGNVIVNVKDSRIWQDTSWYEDVSCCMNRKNEERKEK